MIDDFRLAKAWSGPNFYFTIIYFGVTIICYIISTIIVILVMTTGERKYKNVAHIAWITAVTQLLFGSVVSNFYALLGLMLWDLCKVFKNMEE